MIGDTGALAQCLQNLVINAVKYGGDSKWIGISARRYENENQREIRIAVQDRGIGIYPSDLPHIFEPFYRSREGVASNIHGTGIGLPLAKTLAENMGGSLTVESEAGKGSTFVLHMPFAEDSALRPDSDQHQGVRKA